MSSAEVLGPIGPLADHAVAYAKAGWEVFPAHPATKAPMVENGLYDATCDVEQVRRWWASFPDALIAARVPESVVVLDLDPRHGAADVWRLAGKELGPIPETRRHVSGRGDGGGHLFFQRPKGKLTTRKLAAWAKARGVGEDLGGGRWQTGIDLLHHGLRYTILPPSPHPDTGEPYKWRGEGATAPIAPMPPRLAALLVEDERQAPTQRPLASSEHDGDSIADWFSASTSWADVLAPHGWHVTQGDGESDGSGWRHPAATTHTSATVKYGLLFVYTTSTALEPTEPGDPHGYTRFAAFAALDHGGDLRAAARAARALKGDARPSGGGWIDALPTRAARSAPAIEGARHDEGEAWGEPMALHVEEAPPPWPIEVLPPWMGAHVEAVALALQVPPDLCAQLAVGVLATVAMGRIEIVVADTWREPAVLYLATAMPSGAGKSPADKLMTAPLRRLEGELIEGSRKLRAEARAAKEVADQQAKAAIAAAAKSGSREALADALLAQAHADELGEPPEPRLLVSDVTPEALAQVIANHGGRIAIVSTEAELYDLVLGAYSARPNLGVLLKGWSGDELLIDRKGGAGSPGTAIRVPSALLNISITVQPSALNALAGKPELTSRGFVPRFMHALPRSLVGGRDFISLRPKVTTGADYESRVLTMGRRMARWEMPGDVTFSSEAMAEFFAWRQALEGRIGPQGDLSHLGEFVSKLTGSVARLAGLLHVAEGRATPGVIEGGTLRRALRVGDYWQAHADVLHGRWRRSVPHVDEAHAILGWVVQHRPASFGRRQVHMALHRRFPRAAALDAPLDLLVERGWLRVAGLRRHGSGDSAASRVYEPHPRLLDPTREPPKW